MGDRSGLLWRCRRGVLEMDILCQRFIEQCYPGLTDREKKLFERFLEEADLDILAWIMDKSEPENPDYIPIIHYFRNLTPSPI
ncbi:MAG: succinate dehydrogenase assembly factor 2 [Gammaproteobacteria bacterium]